MRGKKGKPIKMLLFSFLLSSVNIPECMVRDIVWQTSVNVFLVTLALNSGVQICSVHILGIFKLCP